MPTTSTQNNASEIPPDLYEFRVQGILDPKWSEWLECSNITYTTSETILSCPIQDQAMLHGLLAKFRDMNLKLISMKLLESNEPSGV